MQVPEHYISDVQFFFDGNPLELALYQTLASAWQRPFRTTSL